MKRLTHLSLFSGIGGLDLAAEWAGIQTIGQCEWAEYPTKVLEKRWPDVPRWKDIRTLTGESFYERTGRRTVDIISGGFPCQPFSVAGKQRGKEDDRYLWPEMVRVIKELRPTWIVGENVAGIVRMALPDILSELEACGYRTRTFLVPACAVGARHRRYRGAIVAYTNSSGQLYRQNEINTTESREQTQCKSEQCCEDVGYAEHDGLSSAAVAGCIKKTDRGKQKGKKKAGESEGTSESGNGQDVGRAKSMENPSCCRCGKQENVCEQSGRTESERTGETLADTDDGLRKWSHKEIQTRGNATYGSSAREWKRTTESVLGGVADGLPAGMDGDLDFIINHYWEAEPDIPRIATGIEHRVDRLKCLGKAVVPQQFYPIFKARIQVEQTKGERRWSD